MQTAPPLSPSCRARIERFSHPRLIILTENNPFTPWWFNCKLKDGGIFLHYPGHPPFLSQRFRMKSTGNVTARVRSFSLNIIGLRHLSVFITFDLIVWSHFRSFARLTKYTAHLYWPGVYICIYFFSLLLNETQKSHPKYRCWTCDWIIENFA